MGLSRIFCAAHARHESCNGWSFRSQNQHIENYQKRLLFGEILGHNIHQDSIFPSETRVAVLTVIHCAQGCSEEIPIHAALRSSTHLHSTLQHRRALDWSTLCGLGLVTHRSVSCQLLQLCKRFVVVSALIVSASEHPTAQLRTGLFRSIQAQTPRRRGSVALRS